MRVVLSQFPASRRFRRARDAVGEAELFAQTGQAGRWPPLPPEVRAGADGIIHFPPNTNVDGSPEEYPNCAALSAPASASTTSTSRPGAGAASRLQRAGLRHLRGRRPRIALMLALDAGHRDLSRRHQDRSRRGLDACGAPVVAAAARRGLRHRRPRPHRARPPRPGPAASACGSPSTIPISSGMEIAVGAQRCATLDDYRGLRRPQRPCASTRRRAASSAPARSPQAKPRPRPDQHRARLDRRPRRAFDALKRGRVAAAGLDVLPREPADPDASADRRLASGASRGSRDG